MFFLKILRIPSTASLLQPSPLFSLPSPTFYCISHNNYEQGGHPHFQVFCVDDLYDVEQRRVYHIQNKGGPYELSKHIKGRF